MLLAESDAIVAEDTRTTAKLLAIHAISRPRILADNDHSAPRMRPVILGRLGQASELHSSAMPACRSYPIRSTSGSLRAALAAGTRVDAAIPGASAARRRRPLAPPTDRFLFAGFLPATQAARRTALAAELKSATCSLIFFASAATPCGKPARHERRAWYETCSRRPRNDQAARRSPPRRTLHAGGSVRQRSCSARGNHDRGWTVPWKSAPDWERTDALLDRVLADMPTRTAAEFVSDALGLPRRLVYNRAYRQGCAGSLRLLEISVAQARRRAAGAARRIFGHARAPVERLSHSRAPYSHACSENPHGGADPRRDCLFRRSENPDHVAASARGAASETGDADCPCGRTLYGSASMAGGERDPHRDVIVVSDRTWPRHVRDAGARAADRAMLE